ncbi:MAG: HD domain-containing protein [Candidatus Buchananbacteria bacterium]|jgi:GTP pyrophosphokinase
MQSELPKTVIDQESPVEAENHAKFLERLRGKVTESELQLIDLAYDAAKYGHREQFRDDGTRYFEHCRATALILIDELGIIDPDKIIAALLHDMLEDNFLYNPWRLNHIFGSKAAGFIISMTKPKKGDPRFASDAERHKFYFMTIFNSPLMNAKSSSWPTACITLGR